MSEKNGSENRLPLSGPGEPLPEPPQVEGYEVLEWLGGGGMGIVWRAKQLSTGRDVALKVLNQRALRTDGVAQSRFEREVTIAAHLEHPNIVRVYDSGIHKNRYFYAMELIEGKPLDEYAGGAGLTVREMLQLMHRVCLAVQYAHQHGIIHRDLKPSNILVSADGQPHVLDFGLARDVLAKDEHKKVSMNGDLIGTLTFMSPEQAAGQSDLVDTRSDVYSLGVILYWLLTGRFPYKVSGPVMETLHNIASVDPEKPKSTLGKLDADIETILHKTLAKSPGERYSSAAELAEEIRRWLQGLPLHAKSTHTVYLLRKLVRRHAFSSAVVGLLLLICAGFLCASSYLYLQLRQQNRELRRIVEGYEEERGSSIAVRDQLVFVEMLKAWQKGRDDLRNPPFNEEAPEGKALVFLRDPRPLSEKAGKFLQDLKDQPLFATFVLAEHHLHDGERQEALSLFRKCRDYKPNDRDLVLRFRIRERMAELTETALSDPRPRSARE